MAIAFSLALSLVTTLLTVAQSKAQCTELTSGLRQPLGTALTNQGNLLVSETGTPAPRSGRISIIDSNGNRRTLLDGLPSGINDVGDPSGPSGIFTRGRTLYIAIGVGDVGIDGPFPGTTLENPNGPSSPIFSSILAIHFSAATEKTTNGFTLTLADDQALANGESAISRMVILSWPLFGTLYVSEFGGRSAPKSPPAYFGQSKSHSATRIIFFVAESGHGMIALPYALVTHKPGLS